MEHAAMTKQMMFVLMDNARYVIQFLPLIQILFVNEYKKCFDFSRLAVT